MASRPHISRLIESGDRVTPIFRKTGTIMLGADAFSRAEDIEQAVYRELPRLVEQFETLRAAVQKEIDYMDGFPDVEDGSPLALVIESLRLALSNPASEPEA